MAWYAVSAVDSHVGDDGGDQGVVKAQAASPGGPAAEVHSPLSPCVKWDTQGWADRHEWGAQSASRTERPGHCPFPGPGDAGGQLLTGSVLPGNSPGEPPRPAIPALGAQGTSLMEAPVLSHVGITGFTC